MQSLSKGRNDSSIQNSLYNAVITFWRPSHKITLSWGRNRASVLSFYNFTIIFWVTKWQWKQILAYIFTSEMYLDFSSCGYCQKTCKVKIKKIEFESSKQGLLRLHVPTWRCFCFTYHCMICRKGRKQHIKFCFLAFPWSVEKMILFLLYKKAIK